MRSICACRRIVREIETFAEQHGHTLDEVVVAALQNHLFFRRSGELRARMIPEAQAQGLYTD